MRTAWWCGFAALALVAGCEEVGEAVEPEPVAPVEVTSEDDEPGTQTVAAAGDTDVAALEARVAELERQLADRDDTAAQPASGTRVATVPDGVDVPDQTEATPASSAVDEPEGASSPRSGQRTASRRQAAPRAPDLLGALLGDDERPRARREEEGDDSSERGGSLNPVDILGL